MKKIAILFTLLSAIGTQHVSAQKLNAHSIDSAAVVHTILSRRSVRKYKDAPVRRDQMDMILKCGINAPSGMNAQPWEVRVVDNQQMLKDITEAQMSGMNVEQRKRMTGNGFRNMFRNAPSVVFVAVPEGRGELDAGILGENMVLAAWSMGIGSCFLGGPVRFLNSDERGKAFVKKLGFSDGYRLVYAIGFGYPDESPEAKPRDGEKVKYVE